MLGDDVPDAEVEDVGVPEGDVEEAGVPEGEVEEVGVPDVGEAVFEPAGLVIPLLELSPVFGRIRLGASGLVVLLASTLT